jgi:hypothetical protein
MAKNNPSILVTGDVVLDHNLYMGRRLTTNAEAATGMRYTPKAGGAMLTFGLLDALLPTAKGAPRVVTFGLKEPKASSPDSLPSHFNAGALWDEFDWPKRGQRFWRLSKRLGYGMVEPTDEPPKYPLSPAADLDAIQPRIIVIDDGGLGFGRRMARSCWPPAVLDPRAGGGLLEWIILKMSGRLAQGPLWHTLKASWASKLIVVVAADDLRRRDARVARGLSWEQTVDDLLDELGSNPALAGLNACRHLVVTMRGDAALWIANPARSEATCQMVFDRGRAEGEWEAGMTGGDAFGYQSAMTASIALRLSEADGGGGARPRKAAADDVGGPTPELRAGMMAALKAGLGASRFLREYGHGPINVKEEPGFPTVLAAEAIRKPAADDYGVTDVPCPGGQTGGRASGEWSILHRQMRPAPFVGPLFGPARRLALIGPSALEDVPWARFGKYFTVDRREIEALRSLRQMMLSYRDGGAQKQPLSLAAFGAPGSGKSFALKQIAEGVFGEKNPILEFNLSQFDGPADLIGAYHQVRDHVLGGKTPVAFWDEFDSRKYYWLQYLLAPMQDGLFQDGQVTHSIGKCVFVFAGGTSHDFANFGPPETPPADETVDERKDRNERTVAFAMAKGPDFRSRIAGYFNVMGPNRRPNPGARPGGVPISDPSAEEPDFPIRRAIMLRSTLGYVKDREGDRENDVMEIDRGLLTALLEVPSYRHGMRSMEKLVGLMRDRGGLPLRRAYVPSDDVLRLYVEDVASFHALIRRAHAFRARAARATQRLHEDWRKKLSKAERDNPLNVPYGELEPQDQDANIAAVERIAEILDAAGYALVEGRATPQEDRAIRAFLKKHIDALAKEEHDGWAVQKRLDGWTYDKDRDNARRKHDLLVPYWRLDELQKEKDRSTIRKYPDYVKDAGLKIVKRREPAPGRGRGRGGRTRRDGSDGRIGLPRQAPFGDSSGDGPVRRHP